MSVLLSSAAARRVDVAQRILVAPDGTGDFTSLVSASAYVVQQPSVDERASVVASTSAGAKLVACNTSIPSWVESGDVVNILGDWYVIASLLSTTLFNLETEALATLSNVSITFGRARWYELVLMPGEHDAIELGYATKPVFVRLIGRSRHRVVSYREFELSNTCISYPRQGRVVLRNIKVYPPDVSPPAAPPIIRCTANTGGNVTLLVEEYGCHMVTDGVDNFAPTTVGEVRLFNGYYVSTQDVLVPMSPLLIDGCTVVGRTRDFSGGGFYLNQRMFTTSFNKNTTIKNSTLVLDNRHAADPNLNPGYFFDVAGNTPATISVSNSKLVLTGTNANKAYVVSQGSGADGQGRVSLTNCTLLGHFDTNPAGFPALVRALNYTAASPNNPRLTTSGCSLGVFTNDFDVPANAGTFTVTHS